MVIGCVSNLQVSKRLYVSSCRNPMRTPVQGMPTPPHGVPHGDRRVRQPNHGRAGDSNARWADPGLRRAGWRTGSAARSDSAADHGGDDMGAFDGKVAVVTGGASGIGRAIALSWPDAARTSPSPTSTRSAWRKRPPPSRRPVGGCSRSAATCAAMRGRCLPRRDDRPLRPGRRAVQQRRGGGAGPPERVEMADWEWILQINVLGLVRGVRAFVPAMLARGSGHVVNTASVAGTWAYTWDATPYITSKFAAYGYSEALARALKPQGIGVSVLCPGLVTTNLAETARSSGVPPSSRASTSTSRPRCRCRSRQRRRRPRRRRDRARPVRDLHPPRGRRAIHDVACGHRDLAQRRHRRHPRPAAHLLNLGRGVTAKGCAVSITASRHTIRASPRPPPRQLQQGSPDAMAVWKTDNLPCRFVKCARPAWAVGDQSSMNVGH